MIEIYSRNLLVLENGQRATLAVEELRRDLLTCARTVGVDEPWLADHLVLAVEEFVASRATAEPVARRDIDQLAVRLLMQSGYADIADEYARRHHLLPVAVTQADNEEPAAWDSARIAALIRRHFPLAGAGEQQTCSRVAAKLALLGFRQVTDRLVTELAALVLRESVDENRRQGPGLGASPWLVSPEECLTIVQGLEPDARRQEGYGLRPVSRLLPSVHVTLHLNRLGALFDGPPTEMALWPEVRRLATGGRQAVLAMQERVVPWLPTDGQLPARLSIGGADALVDNLCGPMSRAKARRTAREIVDTVRQEAVAGLAFPVLVQTLPR